LPFWYNASVEAASLEEMNKANGPDKARLEQEEKDLQEYLSLNKKGQKEYLEGWGTKSRRTVYIAKGGCC